MFPRLKAKITSHAASAALSVAVVLAPFSATAETLADALVSAYSHSGLLDQNRALLRAADENVAQAVAALRPILSYSGTVQRDFGTTYSAQRQQGVGFGNTDATLAVIGELLLYDGGASRLAVEAAKEAVLSTRQQLIALEQQVLLRAAAAYIAVLRESETVQLRVNNRKLLREELRAARDRFEVGEVTRTDVAQAEARLSAADAALAAARGGLERAREEYAASTGHRPGALKGISSLPKFMTNEERAKENAVRRHPQLRAIQFTINADELNIRRAEAARNPRVTLDGRLSTSQRFDSDNFTNSGRVGITVSGPIYRGGQLTSQHRQAMARRDASRGNLHNTRHAIRQGVGNAFARLSVADASIRANRQQIRAAQVAFRGVREEARLGQRTTLDVLSAEQELLDARTALTAAVAERNIAAFELLSAQGLMTVDYLKLPVQKYDPAEYYNLIKNAPAISRQGSKLDRVLKKLGKQ